MIRRFNIQYNSTFRDTCTGINRSVLIGGNRNTNLFFDVCFERAVNTPSCFALLNDADDARSWESRQTTVMCGCTAQLQNLPRTLRQVCVSGIVLTQGGRLRWNA